MFTDSRQRSAGITASAVVAILGSIGTFLMGAVMALNAFLIGTTPGASRLPNQPAPAPLALAVIMAVFYFAFSAWGISSAVGLLQLRNWARRCFLIFGGLLAFLSFCTAAGSLIAALALPGTMPPAANVQPELIRAVAVVFIAISLIGVAIAVWWLVYFNRSSVKAAFDGGAVASTRRQFPLSISIVAWLLVAGGVINAIQMLLPYPLVLFGIVLRGWAASLALAFLAAVSLSAGIGLVKKRVEAHSLAVGYFGFGILNLVSYLVLPGSFARMQDLVRETQSSQALPVSAMNPLLVFGMLIGVVGTSAILWFLIKARRPFIDACRSDIE